uniref:UNC93-like protein n=1 Tax=Timema poppense TaxID=170557 RepID=A0A7R9D344_TIMPO|nr:unnamed protein product [Timema poppensis]
MASNHGLEGDDPGCKTPQSVLIEDVILKELNGFAGDVASHEVFEPEERWRILRNIVMISFAFMVQFTAFQGAANLQSSVNSSAGLGTASLATIYGALILSNVFLPVVMIRWLGCKWTVALSFIAYMPYIAAQFYSTFYTMIPAALFVGLGGGPLWCGKCTYLSVVADVYSKLTNIPTDTLTIRFFGVFFMIFQCSQIWGNLISSLVFSSDEADLAEDVGDHCGANFCPGTTGSANNSNLARPSDEKIYTVAGIYLGCMVLAVCIVSFGVDSLKRYHEDKRTGSGTGLSGFQLLAVTLKLLKEPKQLLLMPLVMWLGVEQAFVGADYTAVRLSPRPSPSHVRLVAQGWTQVYLIFGGKILMGDLRCCSQSYVSCAWGIRNIGYVMICYGITNSITAISAGSLVKLTGRVPIVTCAAALHVAILVTLLCWTPSFQDRVLFFVMSGLWGVADGVWLVQINAMCGFLFPGREEAAYSNFRLWESLGFIVAYAYSSFLCTYVKLYILLALLVVGLVGYYYIEWGERPNTKKVEKPNKD